MSTFVDSLFGHLEMESSSSSPRWSIPFVIDFRDVYKFHAIILADGHQVDFGEKSEEEISDRRSHGLNLEFGGNPTGLPEG